jgi:hypothetical protein
LDAFLLHGNERANLDATLHWERLDTNTNLVWMPFLLHGNGWAILDATLHQERLATKLLGTGGGPVCVFTQQITTTFY